MTFGGKLVKHSIEGREKERKQLINRNFNTALLKNSFPNRNEKSLRKIIPICGLILNQLYISLDLIFLLISLS